MRGYVVLFRSKAFRRQGIRIDRVYSSRKVRYPIYCLSNRAVDVHYLYNDYTMYPTCTEVLLSFMQCFATSGTSQRLPPLLAQYPLLIHAWLLLEKVHKLICHLRYAANIHNRILPVFFWP